MGITQNTEKIPSSTSSRKILIVLLILSTLINILFLVVIFYLLSSTTNNNTSTSTNVYPTSTIIPTPSEIPLNKIEVSSQECFDNCNVESLLSIIRQQALEVTDFKTHISFLDNKNHICYGNYLESSDQFKEFNSYYFINCPANYLSRPLQTTIHISDDIYYLSGTKNWSKQSEPRIAQTKLIRVIDQLIEQQEKTIVNIDGGDNYKQVQSVSKTVNNLNQVVTKSVNLTINKNLEPITYKIEVGNISTEVGYFFDINTPNTIEKPL